MERVLWKYRAAGMAGGLLLAAGQFWGRLSLLGAAALVPLMVLVLKEERPRAAAAATAGLYMGLFFAIPQMLYLRMPIHITAILLIYMTVLLTGLGGAVGTLLRRGPVIGPLAIGAAWFLIDWINCHALPIWGLAQSFGRSWSAWPDLIGFISFTGIGGVLFVLGSIQGAAAWAIARKECKAAAITGAVVLGTAGALNALVWLEKPSGSIRVAASGWVFDDLYSEVDPHTAEGFEQLFAAPAREAAQAGARIFTTGELGFYIAGHEREEWMNRFKDVARTNDLWLAVGYFNIEANANRLLFMSPQGTIVTEYTKTYLTPLEPGQKGSGCLPRVTVDGLAVGGMICQDDNFAILTRQYGRSKPAVVLCPTADWWTIRRAHLQAVRARALECRYGIVRAAACGISAAIDARGHVTARRDHYTDGAGWIVSDIDIYEGKTVYARFGNGPMTILSGLILILSIREKSRAEFFCKYLRPQEVKLIV